MKTKTQPHWIYLGEEVEKQRTEEIRHKKNATSTCKLVQP